MNYEQIATYSQVISAVLFLIVMVWIWGKFIQPAVLGAQESANRQLAEAERHRDEAKAALGTLQQEIEGARRDADAIRSRASDQARAESSATIADAKESGERLVRNAQGELDRARASARAQLRDDLLEKALARARDEAARRVDDATNAALVSRFVDSIAGSSAERSAHG